MSVNMMSRLNFASLLVIVFVAVLVVDVAANPEGAPQGACQAARPWHTSSSSGNMYTPLNASVNPYRFTVEGTEYVPGQSLQVTIEGTDTDKIYGFFLQARLVSNNDSVGMFDEDSLPTGSKLRPCESTADAITHTNSDMKDDMTFTWTADQTIGNGPLRFVGSIALNHDDFYVGIESDMLMEGVAPTAGVAAITPSFQVTIGVLLLSYLAAALTKTNY